MDTGVLGIVVTALVGLAGIIAMHFYHVRTGREQKTILGKLPDEIVGILKEDAREKLTIPELNELIYEKSVDEDGWEQRDPLPYKACPRCGNTDLTRGTLERPGHTYYIIGCKECDWSESGE